MSSNQLTNNPIVSISDLDFFRGHEKILTNINLDIFAGEQIALVGPNGAGKSTLLNLILNLLPLQKGTIKLFGQPLPAFKSWHKIGYVPQRVTYLTSNFPISVFEVVNLNSHSEKQTLQTLEKLNLLDKKDQLVNQLSGGWQQRVFIARALVNQPELLILDEPTVGVDADATQSFYTLLRNLSDKNVTIILVTHDVHDLNLDFPKIIHLDHQLKFCGDRKNYVCH